MTINSKKEKLNDKEVVVSISCLAFNHELYIRQCLDGFIMQKTNFAFEVLIYDDASTDNTVEIIKEYEVKYPELIKPIYQSENQYSKGVKVSSTYNWSRVKGKYIAMCEGDDYWSDPLKLQKQVDFLEKNEDYGLVHTNFDTYYQDSNYFLKNTHTVYNIEIKDNCTLNYWNLFGEAMATIKTLTACFRYDLIKEWQSVTPENKWLVGDFPMYFFMSLKSKVGYLNESTSVYRTVPQGSLSNVGNDINKKLNIRKTYVDIRLYFFEKYQLEENKFKKALIRDFNILFYFSILLDNKSVLKEYLDKFDTVDKQKVSNKLSRIYLKSNNRTLKRGILYITKIKLFSSTYLKKIFNYKFLISTIKRKLKLVNV
tara:strand:+ start:7997 stop:9106 length:1110 start_codon:yes stop_codon:yes gene_type:complete